jgi:hypothetical protein
MKGKYWELDARIDSLLKGMDAPDVEAPQLTACDAFTAQKCWHWQWLREKQAQIAQAAHGRQEANIEHVTIANDILCQQMQHVKLRKVAECHQVFLCHLVFDIKLQQQ